MDARAADRLFDTFDTFDSVARDDTEQYAATSVMRLLSPKGALIELVDGLPVGPRPSGA